MSDLEEFVSQQKGGGSFFGSTSSSALFPVVGSIRSKFASSFDEFALLLSSRSDMDRQLSINCTEQTNGQLPSSRNRRNGWLSTLFNDDLISGMSKMQRIMAFFASIGASFFCFGLALVLLPTIVLQARKFALLNTLGSAFVIFSFAFLWGPVSYLKHMFSEQRWHVTAVYFLTVAATLYSSLWIGSTLITMLCATVQAVALLWYIISYAPGGDRGLRFLASLVKGFCLSKSTTVLPV